MRFANPRKEFSGPWHSVLYVSFCRIEAPPELSWAAIVCALDKNV
jgi:hypothetical protein